MDDPEIHAGYEFEAGMFSRVRCWVDLFPWLRLLRVPRILASPAYVALASTAWAVSSAWIGYFSAGPQLGRITAKVSGMGPTEATLWSLVETLFVGLVLLLLWAPVIQIIGRAGAGLVADQGLLGFGTSLRITRSRWFKSGLLPLIPLAGALALMIPIWIMRLPSGLLQWDWLATLTGLVVGVAAIPIGVLCFGALFATPLGLIAMVSEPDPDPIDSLSRGYEYLFRRPLHLAWYLVIGGGLLWLARYLLGGVTTAAKLVSGTLSSAVAANARESLVAASVIDCILYGWLITLAIALAGGAYLLLRYDAGGQEVEDLWQPVGPAEPDLPTLPEEAYRS